MILGGDLGKSAANRNKYRTGIAPKLHSNFHPACVFNDLVLAEVSGPKNQTNAASASGESVITLGPVEP